MKDDMFKGKVLKVISAWNFLRKKKSEQFSLISQLIKKFKMLNNLQFAFLNGNQYYS